MLKTIQGNLLQTLVIVVLRFIGGASNQGEIYAQFLKDEKCELRFDNNVKFASAVRFTTNTSVTVTGTHMILVHQLNEISMDNIV